MGAAQRDPYREVGASIREAIERAMPELTLSEAKALLGVISIVASWSRLEDSVSNKQLRDITGMDDSRVRKALRSLSARGAIERTPGESKPGGSRTAGRVRMPIKEHKDRASAEPGVTPTPGHTDSDPGANRRIDPGSQAPASEDVAREFPEAVHLAAHELARLDGWKIRKEAMKQYSLNGTLTRLGELHARFPDAPPRELAQMTSPGSPLLARYVNDEDKRSDAA